VWVVVREAVGSAFPIVSRTKQVTFSFAMFDYGCQCCIFGILNALVIIVCTRTAKFVLQTVVQLSTKETMCVLRHT